MTLNVTKFAAIKGRQSGDDYFTVICEMGLIPKLFLFNESTIPTELRAQRQHQQRSYTRDGKIHC